MMIYSAVAPLNAILTYGRYYCFRCSSRLFGGTRSAFIFQLTPFQFASSWEIPFLLHKNRTPKRIRNEFAHLRASNPRQISIDRKVARTLNLPESAWVMVSGGNDSFRIIIASRCYFTVKSLCAVLSLRQSSSALP